MIITWTICLLIIIVSSFFIFKKMLNNNSNDYDICTKGLRKINIIGFVFYIIGIILYLMSIFMIKDKISFWCSFGMGLFFLILTLILFYENNFSFEAIKGDKFIVTRFFRKKEIKISDINRININGMYIIFYQKGFRKFCFVDSSTRFIQDIISHMQINYDIKVINGNELETMYIDEEEAKEDENYSKYYELGKLYKKNFKNITKENFNHSIIIGVSFSIIFLIIGLIIKHPISLLVVFLFDSMLLIITLSTNKRLKKELNENNYNLGVKHYIEIKGVIGSGKYYFKSRLGIVICLFVFGLFFIMPFSLVDTTPIDFNELIKVEGTLDYANEMEDYIAIGLKETNVEYRITSIEMDHFNYDFFDEIRKGEKIILYVEEKLLDTNNKNVPREFKTYFYYLEANDKEYFTYDNYLVAFNNNLNVGLNIGYLGICTISISIINFIFIFIKYKFDKKKEHISLE